MGELMITVGLPASGKDTFFNELAMIKDFIHVSSDNIRETEFGDVNDQTHNTEVFEIMFNRTIEALNDNKNVYYNATNLSSKRRANLIRQIRKYKSLKDIKITCILFVTPYEECLARNEKRERVVPSHVIKRMYMSFQPPSLAEGFDDILILGAKTNTAFLDRIKELCDKTSHDNPNHSLSIGEHMRAAHRYFIENKEYLNKASYYAAVSEAISMHDIGKSFCKTFINSKGDVTSVAHYYSHENIGAYLYLCYGRSSASFRLYVANLIENHMAFFGGEGRLKKIEEKYGESFYRDLLILHEADIAAH